MGADRPRTELEPNMRRVTVAEAAEVLGITAEEIRRRDMALEREQQLTAMFATRLGELEAPREEREEAVPEARESPVSPDPTPTPPTADAQTATQPRQDGGLRGLRRRILAW
jgi:hypothetical protein